MKIISDNMRYPGLIVLFFLCSTIIYAQDFRQFYWGESNSAVQEKESDGLNTTQKSDIINYSGISLGDEIWDLTYWFIDGKLIAGGYSRELSGSDDSAMKKSLTRKFGSPESENKWITKTTVILYLAKPDKLSILYISKNKIDEFKSAFNFSDSDI